MSDILIAGEPWDRVTPLYAVEGDRWLHDDDDLFCYLETHVLDGNSPSDAYIVLTEAEHLPHFDVREFLSEITYEDYPWENHDYAALNDLVNGWVRENGPWSWYPTNTLVDRGSLQQWWDEVRRG